MLWNQFLPNLVRTGCICAFVSPTIRSTVLRPTFCKVSSDSSQGVGAEGDQMPALSNLEGSLLKVPFHEKNEAKKLGAKWDPVTKQWYDPTSSNPELNRWRPKNICEPIAMGDPGPLPPKLENKFLLVPFHEHDAAKKLGAKWDPVTKQWYDPTSSNPELNRWRPKNICEPIAPMGDSEPLPSKLENKFLLVPFHEHDEAKKLGAKWDWNTKQWYDPTSSNPQLDRWRLTNIEPLNLTGEDRGFGGSELFVDLVPSSCWFTNARSCIHPADWERLRHHVVDRAARRCECCGADSPPLEVHERWGYHDATSTQRLTRLIALCHACHEVTHIGLAGVRGRTEPAMEHLMRVRGMARRLADQHVEQAFALWRERSARTWALDLSLLARAGVRLAQPPPGAAARGAAAEEGLRRSREEGEVQEGAWPG